MKKVIRIFAISLFLILCFYAMAIPYDADVLHPNINENAIKHSSNLSSALNMLGFINGVKSNINGMEIYKWFRLGGTAEDEPISRARDHFHDPLKPWYGAGLNDRGLSGISSIIKAQLPSNEGSWQKAREYYYRALTAPTEAEKEQKLSDAFRALGQVMHLVADASVPEHVRGGVHGLLKTNLV